MLGDALEASFVRFTDVVAEATSVEEVGDSDPPFFTATLLLLDAFLLLSFTPHMLLERTCQVLSFWTLRIGGATHPKTPSVEGAALLEVEASATAGGSCVIVGAE